MAKAAPVIEIPAAPEYVALDMVNREYDATVVKLSVPRIEDKNNDFIDQLVNMDIAVQVHPDDLSHADIKSALFSEVDSGSRRGRTTKATAGDKVVFSPPKAIEGWRIELHDEDGEEEWEELKGKKLLLLGCVPDNAAIGEVLIRVTGLAHHFGGRLMYPYGFRVRFIEHLEADKDDEDDRQTSLDQFVSEEEQEEAA